MPPRSTHNQKKSEDSRKHAGILSRFDIAEDASNETANAAEDSDGKKDDASQNQYVGDGGVGEMVHVLPPGRGRSMRSGTEKSRSCARRSRALPEESIPSPASVQAKEARKAA
jgi:hypothetical protein